MTDEMPTRTKGEFTLEAMSALASAVPYVGGLISTILSGMANDRKFRRLREVLEGMADDLRGFESAATEQYVRTDAFADLLEQTLRRAAEEGNAEKRQAYRALLVNLIRDPIENEEVPRRLLRLLGELETRHLRVLGALIQAPREGLDGASPLATLVGRLPNMELGELQELVAELNDFRLTQIDNWAVMTGHGSPDLGHYLTPLGRQVARLGALGGEPGSAIELERDRPANNSGPHDIWHALRGKLVCLEPLEGIPGTEPDPWFQVDDVTATDVKFVKQSNTQSIRIPLFAMSVPWGTEPEGGFRAAIQSGRLVFHQETERWRWHAQ